MNESKSPRHSLETWTLNLDVDVDRRLAGLRSWVAEWQAEDDRLRQQMFESLLELIAFLAIFNRIFTCFRLNFSLI